MELATNRPPEKMRPRYMAIMELMVMNPVLTQGEIAEALGYTPSRLSIIMNSPVFQLAYNEFRRRHQDRISDRVIDATLEALDVEREIMKDKTEISSLRQQSARDILDLGHAKAIEKKASLNATAEVPFELLAGLKELTKELAIPFKPTRFLQRQKGKEAEDG